MKQFSTILKFELEAYFKNKVFVVITMVLILVLAGVLSFPRFVGGDTSTGEGGGAASGQSTVILTNCDEKSYSYFSAALAPMGYSLEKTDLSEAEMQQKISDGSYERGLIIKSNSAYTSIVPTLSMFDSFSATMNELMSGYYQTQKLEELGLAADQAATVINPQIEETVINTGKDQSQTFFYTYILIFTLYMAILLYGQMVTTSVATEKSSRAMELLITSAKPTSLMFGKVIGSGLAGMLQLSAVFGSAFIFFNLNKDLWAENPIVNSIFNIPGYLLGYMLLFFVLGFFIYAFLFGAVGSMASKLEDVNTLIMPVVLVFVAAFLVVMTSMTSGNMDNPLLLFCSYFPLTSSMAMFTRIAMSNVPIWEVAISVAILFFSTLGIGYLAAKIYRVGVLMYGTKPSFSTIIKSFKQ